MDTLVKGSDRTITVRLQNFDTSPFDLTNTTVIEARFKNADSTITSIKSTDAGTPITQVSVQGGKIAIKITKTQSALFMAQDPAPFSILLTTTAGVLVCNLPDQLTIQEEANA